MPTICLAAATQRGYRCLETLASVVPDAHFVVFSFREEAHEPAFFEDIWRLTKRMNGTFIETRNLGEPGLDAFWSETRVDLMLCVSWRYMIPERIYLRAAKGAFVFHDSLLPRYRGFAPTVWALINGESRTGVTLFEIASEVDAGDIVDQVEVTIGPDETITSLIERVTNAYIEVMKRTVPQLLTGAGPRVKQDEADATYTCKRILDDNRIDWTRDAQSIYNLIRAVTRPYPGAFAFYNEQKITIWAATRTEHRRYVGCRPGRIVEVWPDRGAVVQTGSGLLLITEVQIGVEPPICASKVLKSIAGTLK